MPAELIERVGAVSAEVAEALAAGRANGSAPISASASPASLARTAGRRTSQSDTVHLCVSDRACDRIERKVRLPGSRADVRNRSVVLALHMIRELLLPRSP